MASTDDTQTPDTATDSALDTSANLARYPRVQFRTGKQLTRTLRQRAATTAPSIVTETNGRVVSQLMSAQAQQDLTDYYTLLDQGMNRFTVAEALLLCEVYNSSILEPATVQYMYRDVRDAGREGYGEKWSVDTESLATRLEQMTAFECWQVYQAVRAWWALESSQEHGKAANREDMLRHVGLIA